MKYVKSETGEVFGYDENQEDLYLTAIKRGGVDVSANWPPQKSLTKEQLIEKLTFKVQEHLDLKARTFGYDSVQSAVTYAEEPEIVKFQKEGLAFRVWRSRVWAKCYELLSEVDAGTRETLTAEQVIAELPEFVLEV